MVAGGMIPATSTQVQTAGLIPVINPGRAQVEDLRRGRQNIAERVEKVVRVEDNLIGDTLTVKKHGLPVATVLPNIQLER